MQLVNLSWCLNCLISDDIVVCLGDIVGHRTSNSQVRLAATIRGQKDHFNRILPTAKGFSQTEVYF